MAGEGGGRGVALVTGASGGIGLDVARELAARGYDLWLTARSTGKLAEAAATLMRAHPIQVEVVAGDLADPRGAARLAEALSGRGVVPEVLVNNAGVGSHGRFADQDVAGLLGLIQLNVTSLAELTRRILPGMVARGSGRVLNVASTAGYVPGPFMAAYYASKAFVLSLSVALNEELRGSGVTVTALCPGATRTGFDAAAGVSGSKLFRSGVMESAPVARAGVEAMLSGKPVVVPGLRNKVLAGSAGLGPRWLTAKVARALQDPADMA
ncbi:MAG: SDR family oxidoreductase [Deltaproteobacteria bacterium]|nr:SDR family oxidoreductase [Deltaproteobacteria bacterium]